MRGPNVMRGYLNRPDETARASDGWLHTGDVGYFDDDGYLVLVDRVKDMIIRGGENIYPKEIENVLYRHAACSRPPSSGDPTTCSGEEPVAFVALKAKRRRSVTSCARSATPSSPPTRRPRDIIVVDVLPKNAVGKISKPDLRDLLRSTAPRGVRGSVCQSTGQ